MKHIMGFGRVRDLKEIDDAIVEFTFVVEKGEKVHQTLTCFTDMNTKTKSEDISEGELYELSGRLMNDEDVISTVRTKEGARVRIIILEKVNEYPKKRPLLTIVKGGDEK